MGALPVALKTLAIPSRRQLSIDDETRCRLDQTWAARRTPSQKLAIPLPIM